MKAQIAIDEIPASGLIIEETLEAKWVDFILGESLAAEKANVPLKLELKRKGGNVCLDGNLSLGFDFSCSRCAEDASERLQMSLKCTFTKELDEDDEGDIEIWGVNTESELISYADNQLALEEAVIELIVFQLPKYPLCNSECRGLCATCGQNLNETSCKCVEGDMDPRWAKLKQIELGG